MKTLAHLILAGVLVAGCSKHKAPEMQPGGGEPMNPETPAPGLPTIVSVNPIEAYPERDVSVTLGLRDLAIDAMMQVSFGDGITVNEVEILGGSEVRAKIRIALDAPLGRRDVVVTTQAGTATLASAFLVTSPIEIATQGAFEQGSLFYTSTTHRDEIPFDPATFALTGRGVLTVHPDQISISRAVLLELIAPMAEPGPVRLSGSNSYAGKVATNYVGLPSAITINARTPTLVDAKVEGQTLDGFLATKSYQHNLPASTIGLLDVTLAPSAMSTGAPIAWWFGESGEFDRFFGLFAGMATFPVVTNEDAASVYVVVAENDLHGSATANHDLKFALTPATKVVEGAAAHGTQPGQSLDACVSAGALGACIITGSIGAAGENDYYDITGITDTPQVVVTLRSKANVNLEMQSGEFPYAYYRNVAYGPLDETGWNYLPVRTDRHEVSYGTTFYGYHRWTIRVSATDGKATGDYVIGFRKL